MGGIAGAYQQVDGAELTHRMSGRQSQRGPDGSGLYSFERGRVAIHLAHPPLDTTNGGGVAPFVKEGLALSFSGALYNYRELRSRLTARGVSFLTSGDTEVVLEAWRHWGSGCLRRFRGMFALAIFDEDTRSLYLARDQFGIKPLYHLHRKDGVVFASGLKALISALGEELAIDPGALLASMFYRWVPDRRCSIRNIEKLLPGTWVRFDPDGTHRAGRYWDIAEVAAAAAAGPPVDLREVIEDSVATHLASDAPVASLLSGGLDSSIVTVLAQRQLQGIDAYFITPRLKDHRLGVMARDTAYARQVANQFGMNLKEIEISSDVVDLLTRMVDVWDEPIGHPAAVNTWLMCDAAGQAGSKVVLSGLGADDLFGGYRKHVACLLSGRYQQLPLAARDAISSVVMNLPLTVGGFGLRHVRWAKRFLTFSELPEEAAFRRSYSLYDPIELLSMVGPDLASEVDDLVGEHLEIYWDNQLTDPVSRMCLADARHFLPGLNLASAEQAGMATSTQVRLPFVDPVVFRAAFSLAGNEKVRGHRGNIALKEAARAWLPDGIINRPRTSLSAPLRAWIARDLSQLIDDVLVSGQLVTSGFLRPDAIRHLIADQRNGREDRSKHIWQLLTLELWCQGARAAGVGL